MQAIIAQPERRGTAPPRPLISNWTHYLRTGPMFPVLRILIKWVAMRFGAAVDLFCGAGGLTHGFREAGISVKVGVDIDPTCRLPFEHNNHKSRFVLGDVASLQASEVASWFPQDSW